MKEEMKPNKRVMSVEAGEGVAVWGGGVWNELERGKHHSLK